MPSRKVFAHCLTEPRRAAAVIQHIIGKLESQAKRFTEVSENRPPYWSLPCQHRPCLAAGAKKRRCFAVNVPPILLEIPPRTQKLAYLSNAHLSDGRADDRGDLLVRVSEEPKSRCEQVIPSRTAFNAEGGALRAGLPLSLSSMISSCIKDARCTSSTPAATSSTAADGAAPTDCFVRKTR